MELLCSSPCSCGPPAGPAFRVQKSYQPGDGSVSLYKWKIAIKLAFFFLSLGMRWECILFLLCWTQGYSFMLQFYRLKSSTGVKNPQRREAFSGRILFQRINTICK